MMFIYSKFRKKSFWLVFFIIYFICSCFAESCTQFKRKHNIKIKKNGYTDVIVGIKDDVEENVELIDNIKQVFTEASNFLFSVTKKRAYFREVTIIIPNSWKIENYYDDYNKQIYDGILQNATWESYDRSDICIEKRDMFTLDKPYVVNYASNCGETGWYINFASEYFLNKHRSERLFGPYANVFVNMWSQFKYGLFSEYSYKDLDNSEEFYLNSNGEIEATRCSLNITGTIKSLVSKDGACKNFKFGLPSKECVFVEDIEQNNNSTSFGSLLYKPFVTQLNEFCDNNTNDDKIRHNRFAPNIQNKECNGQSVWEVLRHHYDFKEALMPNVYLKTVTPKFQILKNRIKKVVILIDKALRTEPEHKFIKIEKALKEYVKHMLEDNVMVGIIHFDNFAKIRFPMTKLRDVSIRRQMLDVILPGLPGNKKSNIWNAISLGISLLKTTMNPIDKLSVTGGNMIIITNSNLDPNYPNNHNVDELIKLNEIVIDLVRIDEQNDGLLQNITRSTGGISFLIKQHNPYINLENILAYISNRNTRSSKKTIELINKNIEIYSTLPIIGYLYIDESIATRRDAILKITFDIEIMIDSIEYLEIKVYEPNSKQHLSKYNLKCKDSSLSYMQKSDLANTQHIVCDFKRPRYGKWIYEIINPASQNIKVNIKSHVYFYSFIDESTYYENYYDRENYLEKRLKRQQQHQIQNSLDNNFQSEIRLEGRWYKNRIQWPGTQAIFASVSKGLKPILNATVKAHIFRPSGDTIELTLRDDGLFADRFKNDGVYSRYFANFDANGEYFALLEIDSFDELIQIVNSVRIIVYNKDNWKLSTCTCPRFAKHFKCNHIIAIAVRKRLFEFDPKAMTVKVGYTRTRCRPANTTMALVRQPNENFMAEPNDDLVIDEVQELQVEPSQVVGYDIEVVSNGNTKVHMQKIVGTSEFEHYPTIGVVNDFNEEYSIRPLDQIQRADLIKPSKIKDLKLIDIDYAKKFVKFSFTSPGNDADLGRVSNYEIKCSHDIEYLYEYKNKIDEEDNLKDKKIQVSNYQNKLLDVDLVESSFFGENGTYNPNQAGIQEYFILNANHFYGDVFSIKIRAIDSSNNSAPWSDLLTVKLDANKIEFSPNIRLYVPNDTTENDEMDRNDSSSKALKEKYKSIEEKEKFYSLLFILFICFLCIIFIIQIGMIIALTVYKINDCRYESIKPVRV